MEDFSGLIAVIKNCTGIANDFAAMLKIWLESVSGLNSEKALYRRRVRTRAKNGECRPEWDIIGRCIFYENPSVANRIEMDSVPKKLQDCFENILQVRCASGYRTGDIEQLVSDQEYTYLIEAGRLPGVAHVHFGRKPN